MHIFKNNFALLKIQWLIGVQGKIKNITFPIFQLIRESISRQKNIQVKSCDVDLVTETDQMVEKLLMDGISAKFPDHKYDCI